MLLCKCKSSFVGLVGLVGGGVGCRGSLMGLWDWGLGLGLGCGHMGCAWRGVAFPVVVGRK